MKLSLVNVLAWLGARSTLLVRVAVASALLLATPTPIAAAIAPTESSIWATNLRVDDAHDPLGISPAKPYFSWQVRDDVRGATLVGYHLVVATSATKAESGLGDIWDTGFVASDVAGDVAYEGPALEGSTSYFWSVRPTTSSGHGNWAEPATFETALSGPGEWSGAEWIAGIRAAEAETPNAWPVGSSAEASSSHSSGGYAVAKIIDGNPSTYWNDNTNGQFPDWVQVNSSAPVTAAGITLTSNKDGGPKDFTIDVLADGGWQRAATVTDNTSVTTYVPFTSALTFTRLRITITSLWEGTPYPGWSRVGEIALGDSRGSGWPSGSIPTASSTHANGDENYELKNAIDGDLSTYWNDNTSGEFPDWIQIDSPDDVSLPGVTIAGNKAGGPKDFTVEVMIDGAFETVAEVTGNTDLTTYVAFSQPVVTKRLRITINATWDTTAFPGWTRVGEIYPGRMPAADTSAPLLRRDFDVDRRVRQARLYVTGVGNFVATINGERVGGDLLDPAFTMYNKRVLYVTHDVTDLVREGSNAIGLELGRGFFGLTTKMPYWGWDRAVWHGEPRGLVKLQIDYKDGTSSTVVSDDSWTTTQGPRTADSIYAGENFDSRRAMPGWASSGYDDAAWVPATVVPGPGGQLVPQQIEPVRMQGDRAPIDVITKSPTSRIYDFGGVRTGWAKLVGVNGPAGTKVEIRYGERIGADGNVSTDGLQTDNWTLDDSAGQSFEPQFTWKSYRYIQVSGNLTPLPRDSVIGRIFHTDVGKTGQFSSDNELFNRIHAASTQTLANNLTGFPTDTPMYEKNGWTGDFMLGMTFGPKTYDMRRFIQKWLDDIDDSQLPDGSIPLIIPADGHNPPTVNAPWGNAPEWSAALPTAMFTLWQTYGKTSAVREHWSTLEKYLDYQLGVMGPDYITTTSLGDWVAPEASSDREITATAYVYQAFDQAEQMADAIGKNADAARYEDVRNRIRSAFNAKFFRSDAGYYRSNTESSYRQASNAIPLALGLVPDGRAQDVASILARDVKARGDKLATGILGTAALLPALTENGYADTAAAVVNQKAYPSWGYWLESGWDTLLEAWGTNARSANHYMFGTVDSWFYNNIAGIRSTSPGGRTLRFAPQQVGGVDAATGSLDTVNGVASINWKSTGDAFMMDVTVPVGSTATVAVPVAAGRVVTESRRSLESVEGISDVVIGEGIMTATLGSGTYELRAAHEETGSVSLTLSGKGDGGWYGSNATLSLESLAPEDAVLEYRFGDSEWMTYSTPVVLNAGTYTVGYRLRLFERVLDIGAETVKVDVVSPTATASVGGRTVTLAADDQGGSGVASIQYAVEDGLWVTYTDPVTFDGRSHAVAYRASDVAGNVGATQVVMLEELGTGLKEAPRAVSLPTLSGNARVASILRASSGTWDQDSLTFNYQWLRDGVAVPGATSRSYRLQLADARSTMAVKVTAARTGHADGLAQSKAVRVPRAATKTSVEVDYRNARLGQKVKSMVRVTSSAGRPSGDVVVTYRGRTLRTLSLKNGVARASLHFKKKFRRALMFRYAGDDHFAASKRRVRVRLR